MKNVQNNVEDKDAKVFLPAIRIPHNERLVILTNERGVLNVCSSFDEALFYFGECLNAPSTIRKEDFNIPAGLLELKILEVKAKNVEKLLLTEQKGIVGGSFTLPSGVVQCITLSEKGCKKYHKTDLVHPKMTQEEVIVELVKRMGASL